MTAPNIILDSLPETVEVNGRVIPINTDFRIGMMFEQLILDREATSADRATFALGLFFPGVVFAPGEVDPALEQIAWFYRCGKPEKSTRGAKGGGIRSQIYDFEHDAPLIYAAFMAAYRIDLTETDMHWWKFRALFSALPGETELVKIMGYRAMDLRNIKDKEQRMHYRRLQETYRLPDGLTDEEKIARAGALFAGGIGSAAR